MFVAVVAQAAPVQLSILGKSGICSGVQLCFCGKQRCSVDRVRLEVQTSCFFLRNAVGDVLDAFTAERGSIRDSHDTGAASDGVLEKRGCSCSRTHKIVWCVSTRCSHMK